MNCKNCSKSQSRPTQTNFLLPFFMILFALIAVDFWGKAANSFFFEKLKLSKSFENYFATALFITLLFVFALQFFNSFLGNNNLEKMILETEGI